ncbi:ABC transporter related protein [Sulfobacillus acidophilus TPY]|uniref:Monosaccharide-transporting ATPase n=1 Tax=Sulfobacillus acidophilus (strain ATCC 700253 / DSM 10332 / NAL) TaxID=679936 RepID=G8TZA9_SULAD|nr:ABC transporter related protein [Sulfobacillus acidophilus TPY]AEW04078.1 Monosaccharide-transporting ATPase [Sulfobacillus acidophilus DSM 10332]
MIDQKEPTPPGVPAIVAQGVTKALGHEVVLANLDLTVHFGEIIGIVGPNGSGKTLLLRLLCGFAYPDAGTIQVDGRDLSRPGWAGHLATNVGVLIETPGFLPYLSGFDNLRLLALIQNRIGPSQIREALERVGLDPHNRRPVRTYSLGMRQRLGIAQAIMEQPRILLLDEPTNGLDPEFTDAFLALMRRLRDGGTAIVWTSHELDEVRSVADRVLTVRQQRLVAVSSGGHILS